MIPMTESLSVRQAELLERLAFDPDRMARFRHVIALGVRHVPTGLHAPEDKRYEGRRLADTLEAAALFVAAVARYHAPLTPHHAP